MNCPICGDERFVHTRPSGVDGTAYDCGKCGAFWSQRELDLAAEVERLREILRSVEWGGTTADHFEGIIDRTCPFCGGLKSLGTTTVGHLDGCPIAEVLKEEK